MIDLQVNSGLSLFFDEISQKFQYGEGVVFDAYRKIPLTSMLPGLLNKSLKYPETVYMEHKNIRHQDDNDFFKATGFHYDIVMLPAGLMGVEFIRSHIFFSELEQGQSYEHNSVSEVVECLSGIVTILFQKNAPKNEWEFGTRVSEGLVVKLKEGEKFVIPRGYYYTFINTRSDPTVFSRFYAQSCACDYTSFEKEQGLAYFAIRKNAKQEIVLNPRYREIPQIQNISCGEQFCSDTPDLTAEPLYAQVRNREEEFNSLFRML
jgi:hypothetical protein